MTVDWRQNPDGTLVRGTRISSYRKLQCNYKCYKCVKQTHSRSGVRKRSKNGCFRVIFILWFVKLHITQKAHSHNTHAHKHRKMRRGLRISIGMICGWEGSGQAQGHLLGVWARGSSAQTGRVFETAAYEAWAYKNLLT